MKLRAPTDFRILTQSTGLFKAGLREMAYILDKSLCFNYNPFIITRRRAGVGAKRICREKAAGVSFHEAALKVGPERNGSSRNRAERAVCFFIRNSGGTAVFYRPEIILGAFCYRRKKVLDYERTSKGV